MSHRKEISHVHLITCYKAQEKVNSTHRKPQTDFRIGCFAGYIFRHLHWFVDMKCSLLPSNKKNAESKGVLINSSCKFVYNLILTNAEPKYTKDK